MNEKEITQASGKQKRKPLYRRVPSENIRLQERDREIIYEVFRHRFLNSRHIIALTGGSPQRILRRLQSLFHADYLSRPLEQIRPYKTGSDPMVYGIGNKGAELLAKEYQIPRGKINWTRKNKEVKQIYLDHALLVANFMVCLEMACRGRKDVQLIEYHADKTDDRYENIDPVEGWRVKAELKTENGVKKYQISIVPDKIFLLYFPNDPPGENKALFFLEADRSTMPLIRSDMDKSCFYKKLVGYWASFHQEKFEELFGFNGARILTVAQSQQRIDNIIQANKTMDDRKKGSKMFLFLSKKEINIDHPERLLEPIWQNGRDDQLTGLLE
jgi:hypothetical protein